MPANLLNQNISLTYQGLLHAQGSTLPSSGNVIVTDGAGKYSSLSLGTSGTGIGVTGDAVIDGSVYASYGVIEVASVSSVFANNIVQAPNTPKAWVVFSGNDGTIRSSFNVATVARNTAGDYTITFSNALASSNYTVNISISYDNTTPYMVCSHAKSQPAPSTTAFGVKTYRLVGSTPTQFDASTVSVVVHHA